MSETIRKPVVVFTDGDDTAFHALSKACEELQCHPLRASRGNPTHLTGDELVRAVVNAPQDPVVVMVDDRGDAGQGEGENALKVLLQSSEVEVLGVVAVAANTQPVHGVDVVVSVTQDGQVIEGAVDKSGEQVAGHLLRGDTVDVLESYQGPVVGLGDPGKMDGHDSVKKGVPVTKKALQEVLQRSGWDVRQV